MKKIIYIFVSIILLIVFAVNLYKPDLRVINAERYLNKKYKEYEIIDILDKEDYIYYLIKYNNRLCLTEFEKKFNNLYFSSGGDTSEMIGISYYFYDGVTTMIVYFNEDMNVNTVKCEFWNSSESVITFEELNVIDREEYIFPFNIEEQPIKAKVNLLDDENNIIFSIEH